MSRATNKKYNRIKNTESIVNKLIRNNSGYSIKSFFLLVITGICFILLMLPVAAIIIDLIYNHTVTMSWSEIGIYIGSVFTGTTGAGIIKAWSERYERHPGPDGIIGTEDDVIIKRNMFSCDNNPAKENLEH